MKKVIAFLAVSFALTLSACTKKEEAPSAPESAPAQVEGSTTPAATEGAAPAAAPAETEEKKAH